MKKKSEKGTCYESSLRFVWDAVDKKFGSHMTLVHGRVFSKALNKVIGHAWVEIGDVVIDAAHSLTCRKEKYYRIAQVEVTNKYSATEASKMALRFKHFGPWNF